MESHKRMYKAHCIELRAPLQDSPADPVLLIEDVPVDHGRLPDRSYYLRENAYEWSADLSVLAERLLDRRARIEGVKSQRVAEGSE